MNVLVPLMLDETQPGMKTPNVPDIAEYKSYDQCE